jgi:hypothetical protein
MKVCLLKIFVFIILGLNQANAQCIDPLAISPGFPCPDPNYKPVCGCDGETYRHSCEAQYKHGVQYWSDGPCSGLEFDIIPTFVGPLDNLTFSFSQNKGVTATLYILDYYGKRVHQQILPALSNFNPPEYQITFDLSSYRPGVYIMAITNSKGDYRYKKFVKY